MVSTDILIIDLNEKISIKSMKEKRFYHVRQMTYDDSVDLKTIYDTYSRLKLNLNDIYKVDDYYILRDDSLIHGLVSRDEYDIKFTLMGEGKYLTFEYTTDYIDDMEARYIQLVKYMIVHQLSYEGELYFKIGPELYKLNDNKYYCEMLIRIKDK